MWFGTEDGLNMFDGINIRVFRNDPADSSSLLNNSVYCIVSDPGNGNLWIGTRMGLSYFDKNSFSFKTMFQNEENDFISGHIIFDLKFDADNKLWIASSYGLFSYSTTDNKLKRYIYEVENEKSISSNIIENIFIDTDNKIYLGTREGIDLYNPVQNDFSHLFQNDSLRFIKQIFKDSYSEYWICTDNMGVFKARFGETPTLYNPDIKDKNFQPNDRIHSIVEDNNGHLIFVARDKGLFFYNRDEDKMAFFKPDVFDTNSLNSKALISSFKSSTGIIWFGTFNSGINYIDNSRKPFEHFKVNYKTNGLFNNNIRSFFQDKQGNIWVGTKEGGGLSRFDPSSGTFVNFMTDPDNPNSISSDYILCINELDNNTLILGTLGAGIDLFDKRTKVFRNIIINPGAPSELSDNKVYSILVDSSGTVWVASLNNLYRFNKENESFNLVDGIRSVKCFAQRKDEDIWMGTRFDGLACITDDKITYYNTEKKTGAISSNQITSLRFANDSLLWIGTIDGLNLFNLQDSSFRSWNENSGLPGSRISAVEIDNQGNVWASTSNGLSRFYPETGQFKNYFSSDGLQGNEFEMYVSMKSFAGDLFFGGSNGFNFFNPETIKDNPNKPKVQFTDFKIANKSVPINTTSSPLKKHINKTDKITLKYSQADFTFQYVALNFTSPEKNKYKYMLEGYDDDWVEGGTNPFATYTNISSGDYVFKVIASNNDNVWNTKGRYVKIKILPPPWKSVWAYIIYFIIIALLVLGLYYFIVKRIEQQSLLMLERKEREKTDQLNQMKLRFFTNISHEFRTPLTLISSPLSKLMNQKEYNPEEQKYLFATMQKNVKRLLRLIKQLMDFRKLENQQLKIKIRKANMSDFIQEIIDGFVEYASNKKITIRFEAMVHSDTEQWFDTSILDSVIFNLLSNAVKFSNENSDINVELDVDEHFAIIKVVDHGIGIPADKIDKIFTRFYSEGYGIDEYAGSGIGLSFSQNLISLHKGEIKVNSVPGVETAFTIKIPVNKDYFSSEEIFDNQNEVLNMEPGLSAGQESENSDNLWAAKREARQNTSLLIVEDNVELRLFLKNHFNYYRIIEANDGLEALKKARKGMPDIIISDVMMPNMDGIEFCRELKSDFITSHIPVILLTAKSANEYKIEGFESGADAYIEKPFDIKLLEVQVNSILFQREMLRKRFSNSMEVQPADLVNNECDQQFFNKVEKVVLDNIQDPDFAVDELSKQLNMSRSQLFRKFKAILDNSPSDYIRQERIKLAKKLLEEGNHNVNEVSFLAGFSSPSYFIATFKKFMACTPKEYIQR